MADQNNTDNNRRNRQRSPRNEFVQKRKSLPYSLQVQSNALLNYMERNGGAAAGAFQRIAGLIQLTANNPVVRERLDTWFESVIEVATERANALSVQQERYSEDLVTGLTRPKVPDNYQYTVEITHPVFWKFIGLVEMVDNVMAEMEFLWLSGQLDDVNLENASGQAVNTIRSMVNRIYYVTNASRTRKGGLYSASSYNDLMSSLNKGESDESESESRPESQVNPTANEQSEKKPESTPIKTKAKVEVKDDSDADDKSVKEVESKSKISEKRTNSSKKENVA